MSMPIIFLFVWFIILLVMAGRDEGSYLFAISVLLVGISIITAILGFLKIKGQKYRINTASIMLILIATI